MEKLNQQWSEIMAMNFYDFQNLLDAFADILDDRRKEDEEDAKRHGYDESKYNPDSMMRSVKNSMPKMPNINIPKF